MNLDEKRLKQLAYDNEPPSYFEVLDMAKEILAWRAQREVEQGRLERLLKGGTVIRDQVVVDRRLLEGFLRP